MNSVFDFDALVTHRRQQLLAEADAERLVCQLHNQRRRGFRVRLAAILHALADWLCADTCALETSQAPT